MDWFYFGCGDQTGHYLFNQNQHKVKATYGKIERSLEEFDGILPPFPELKVPNYKASFSRLGGLGYSALSWWDRSVDSRPGSSSTIFAPDLTIPAPSMLILAQARFPWVFSRLPQPVTLLHPE